VIILIQKCDSKAKHLKTDFLKYLTLITAFIYQRIFRIPNWASLEIFADYSGMDLILKISKTRE